MLSLYFSGLSNLFTMCSYKSIVNGTNISELLGNRSGFPIIIAFVSSSAISELLISFAILYFLLLSVFMFVGASIIHPGERVSIENILEAV